MGTLGKGNDTRSELEYEIQRLSELESEEFAKLEQRYTEDDLVFAWGCGYESRKMEETEQEQESSW